MNPTQSKGHVYLLSQLNEDNRQYYSDIFNVDDELQ